MKVRLNTTLAGPKHHGYPGEVHDFPEAMARELLAKGYAYPLETSMMEPAENAMQPKAKARK